MLDIPNKLIVPQVSNTKSNTSCWKVVAFNLSTRSSIHCKHKQAVYYFIINDGFGIGAIKNLLGTNIMCDLSNDLKREKRVDKSVVVPKADDHLKRGIHFRLSIFDYYTFSS